MAGVRMGRFAEPALWVLVALGRGPSTVPALFNAVRALDGPIGPGRLLGALARLERRALVERTPGTGTDADRPMYRLATRQPSKASR